MNTLYGIIIFVCASWTSVWANEPPVRSAPTFQIKITDKADQVDALFFPLIRGDAPGAALIVVREGQVLMKTGYGFANLETRKPITPDTAFLLASLSKTWRLREYRLLPVKLNLRRG